MNQTNSLASLLCVCLSFGLGACSSNEDDLPDASAQCYEADGDGGGEQRLFSIAIIADTHIGEGQLDFGTPGFSDSEGQVDDLIRRVEAAVSIINSNISVYDIDFVMVLGDLTDSGEISEMRMAKQVLDELRVPYFPLLGNHDIWPYCWTSEQEFVEAPEPNGDLVFHQVFREHFQALSSDFPSLSLADVPIENPDSGQSLYLYNYAFDHFGWHFIALDIVTRVHAPDGLPGIGPQALLHDFPGGTYSWLEEHLSLYPCKGDENVLVFSHHPPIFMDPFGLSGDEHQVLEDFVQSNTYGPNILAFFAGHLHLDMVGELLSDRKVVVTSAAKDNSTVRVIQFFADGESDFETLISPE